MLEGAFLLLEPGAEGVEGMEGRRLDAEGILFLEDVGADIFQRGLCLPRDNKMTAAQQERIIQVIRACFE